YAVGGGDDFSFVAEYDPASDVWVRRALLVPGRVRLGVAVAANGRLYAAGGEDAVGFSAALDEATIPGSDAVATGTSTPAPTSTVTGTATPTPSATATETATSTATTTQ